MRKAPSKCGAHIATRGILRMLKVLSLSVFASALFGCALPVTNFSGAFADAQTDQPWIAPGVRARATVHIDADFVRLDQRLLWIHPDGREFDADRLVARCETYLRAKGVSREPQGEDADGTPMPAVRWGSHGEALIAPVLIYPNTPMIVCVEPLVVFICPEPRRLPRDEETPGATDESIRWRQSVRHTLQHGYQRGTSGHCAGELLWFSPDLEFGPEPVPLSEAGTATLRTQWGAIEVFRNGATWTVSAKRWQ